MTTGSDHIEMQLNQWVAERMRRLPEPDPARLSAIGRQLVGARVGGNKGKFWWPLWLLLVGGLVAAFWAGTHEWNNELPEAAMDTPAMNSAPASPESEDKISGQPAGTEPAAGDQGTPSGRSPVIYQE